MQHGDIWRGLDLLAQNHGLSPSGLAKLAGLDATAFNKSKRWQKNGRPRWPSTESIALALDAVDVGFDAFAALVTETRGQTLPLYPHTDPVLHQAKSAQNVEFAGEPELFMIEIASDEFDPVYKVGARLVVSAAAPLEPGKRLLIKRKSGAFEVGEFVAHAPDHLKLSSVSEPAHAKTIARDEIDWFVRILWLSQ
jgi:hypothetical protein